MQILVATDFSTRSNRAVRQAGLLAQAPQARLTLVHVVDDDQPEALVEVERREAERILDEQIGAVTELKGVACHPVVVSGSPFSGILRTAESFKADLIVMGSHRRQILFDIFVGTTVERVIRTGPFPVLMVNNEAQRHYEKVVAAVGMSAQSARTLQIAKTVGLIAEGRATLLHAFLPLAKGKMYVAGTSTAEINEYVASEQLKTQGELIEFLMTNDLGSRSWELRVEEGAAMEVISSVVSEKQADLLILGTHGRSAFLKALIGSVTEEALRSLAVDILAVPAVK